MLENSDLRFQVLKDSVDRGGSAVHQRVIGVLVTNNIVFCLSLSLAPRFYHISLSLSHTRTTTLLSHMSVSLSLSRRTQHDTSAVLVVELTPSLADRRGITVN